MFNTIKAEGGMTRFLLKKVYMGERLKQELEYCDRMELEKIRLAEARKNKDTFVKRVNRKLDEFKAKRDTDEYEESLEVTACYLQSIDGVARGVITLNNSDIIVKKAEVMDIVDGKLEPYKKKLNRTDLIKKDYNTHPTYVKFGNNYSRIVTAEKLEDNILVNFSDRPKYPDYAIISM